MRGRTRIKGRLDDFFKSITWAEVMKRLEGRHPLVFVIMKKEGATVQSLIIKDGANFESLYPAEIKRMQEKEVEPKHKEKIDAMFPKQKDVDAIYNNPKIEGLEPHEKEELPPAEEPGKEPEPTTPLTNGHQEDEINLEEGMEIIYKSSEGGEQKAKIVSLFEEENQLLISLPGTKRKEIIDVAQIKRLA